MKRFLFLSIFMLSAVMVSSQVRRESIVQKAHKTQINIEEFSLTDAGEFKIKLFSVGNAIVNKKHHWFIQLLSSEDQYINFAKIEATGYLKSDPSIQFSYFGTVTKLCTEGKYVVGFVKVEESGTWVLDIEIDEYGKVDKAKVEIEIPE